MKKILFTMFMALTFVMNAKANVSDYVGEYYGTLSNIMMNNKTGYADQTMSFFITADGKLHGEIGQIGKMPGKITIDMDVDIDEDGNMTAVYTKAGVLDFTISILGSSTLYLDEDGADDDGATSPFVGTIKSNKMNFTLYVVGKYLGASFPARVSFEGTKK